MGELLERFIAAPLGRILVLAPRVIESFAIDVLRVARERVFDAVGKLLISPIGACASRSFATRSDIETLALPLRFLSRGSNLGIESLWTRNALHRGIGALLRGPEARSPMPASALKETGWNLHKHVAWP